MMINAARIEAYVDRVYAYAVKRTFSEEEAADLSQEILLTVLRQLPTLQNEDRFEAWLWGIANNTTKSFRRRMGKQRAMFSYDFPEDLAEQAEDSEETEAMYATVRQKIAMLSAMYRDIIILHYYDCLSVKQISQRLHIPEGTVTWRLSEARRKLKKECTDMQESALRPVKLSIGIYGSGNFDGKTSPFPFIYINDALSQNILYASYEKPLGIEDLAKICGVPAYYIEERIDHLRKHQAIIEPTAGKFQTNFIIWSDKHGIYCEENEKKVLEPLYDKLMTALKQIAADADRIDFYKAEKSPEELFYLYGILAFSYAKRVFCPLPCPPIEEKYDGFRWSYIGSTESGAYRKCAINTNHSANLGSRGRYSHTVYCGFGSFAFRRNMMYDYQINVCEDLLVRGESEDTASLASAIQAGYITRREDGSLFVTVPAFTKAQFKQFEDIAQRHLQPVMEEYSLAVREFATGFKQLFPKHLQEDADRMCHEKFFHLYSALIEMAQARGDLILPEQDSICDVLIQFKH